MNVRDPATWIHIRDHPSFHGGFDDSFYDGDHCRDITLFREYCLAIGRVLPAASFELLALPDGGEVLASINIRIPGLIQLESTGGDCLDLFIANSDRSRDCLIRCHSSEECVQHLCTLLLSNVCGG